MARYKLTLAYDGTGFFGSQKQARRRTVQAELEKAARRLGWGDKSLSMAGRTDAGVHSLGQVAALDLEWRHSGEALRDALNAALPDDLVVLEALEVPGGFHPRYDATSREYSYAVRCGALRNPIADRSAWRVWPAVPVADLNRAARLFIGRHDFGAFGSPPKKDGSTIRSVTVSEWSPHEDRLHYSIVADGFLYRMVRRLVFVQVALSQGKCTEQALRGALQGARRASGLPAGLAPAQGLTLRAVKY